MQNVLVIFQATTNHTEGLALAIGLGAVRHGANIRLRHLNPSPSAELAHAGYGVLQGSDLAWAEGVAVVLEGELLSGLGELHSSMNTLTEGGIVSDKWAFVTGEPQVSVSVPFVKSLFVEAGFKLFPYERGAEEISLESFNEIGKTLANTAAKSE